MPGSNGLTGGTFQDNYERGVGLFTYAQTLEAGGMFFSMGVNVDVGSRIYVVAVLELPAGLLGAARLSALMPTLRRCRRTAPAPTPR